MKNRLTTFITILNISIFVGLKTAIFSRKSIWLYLFVSLFLIYCCKKQDKVYTHTVTYQVSLIPHNKGKVSLVYMDSLGREVSTIIEGNWSKQITYYTTKSPDVIGSIAAITILDTDSYGFIHDNSKVKIKARIKCDKEVVQDIDKVILLTLIK